MNKAIIFIYTKDNKIKALDVDEATKEHNDLLYNGWIHTQTLNACVFIEHLHNDCDNESLLNKIDSLKEQDN